MQSYNIDGYREQIFANASALFRQIVHDYISIGIGRQPSQAFNILLVELNDSPGCFQAWPVCSGSWVILARGEVKVKMEEAMSSLLKTLASALGKENRQPVIAGVEVPTREDGVIVQSLLGMWPPLSGQEGRSAR